MMRKEVQRPGWQTLFRWGLLLVLAVLAAGMWWMEGREKNTENHQPTFTPAPTSQSDQRLKRETAYDRDVAALQTLLESGAADAQTQEMAAQKLTALIAEHQSEIGLEEALLEAGYTSAVVIVQNGSVTVMIPKAQLNEEASAQILALCVAHAEVGAENVRVMGMEW